MLYIVNRTKVLLSQPAPHRRPLAGPGGGRSVIQRRIRVERKPLSRSGLKRVKIFDQNIG